MGVSRDYKELITYWAPSGGDDGYGNQVLGAPVTFRGHWSDEQRTFLSPRGEQIVSRAVVHYPQNMTIVPDGWLCKGIQTGADPKVIPGAIIVRDTHEIPDVRSLEAVKVATV